MTDPLKTSAFSLNHASPSIFLTVTTTPPTAGTVKNIWIAGNVQTSNLIPVTA